MKRRWPIRLAILVILAAFIVWLEPTRVVWGWLRGESFYQGRPTSYWRGEMQRWQYVNNFGGGFGGWQREPNLLQRCLPEHFPPDKPRPFRAHDITPPFLNDDAALTPVLHELKNDPSRRVRENARNSLRYQAFKRDPANQGEEPPSFFLFFDFDMFLGDDPLDRDW